jgi:hypothetical protein
MLEPLERIERQLVMAVGPARRRRRRRRLIVPSVAATMVLALASAASAITGVGPVGDMLVDGAYPTTGDPLRTHLTLAGGERFATTWPSGQATP